MADRVGIAAALLFAASACAASAEDTPEATLSAREGPLAVTGRILAYDGDAYRIDTAHGPLTLDASEVVCAGAGCPEVPSVVVEGDPVLAGVLMPALIEAFAARRDLDLTREALGPRSDAYLVAKGAERLRIELRRSGSGAGLAALASGAASAALSRRAAQGPEIRAAREGALGAIAEGARRRVLALDALVPVVSPANPVRALSLDEIAAAFSGEIEDWSALGGEPGPVSLHLTAEGDGAAEAFEDAVMRPGGFALSAQVVRHPDMASLARAVARDRGALGVASLGDARPAEPLALRGACGLVSRPGANAARAGDWPLTLPLRLVLPARPLPPLMRELIAYAASPAAQGVVRRAGLIDQAPREIPLGAQGDRLAAAILAAAPSAGEGAEAPLSALRAAVADLRDLTRLTLTFRFEGGLRLDASSREAVERLASRIASGALDGRTLVFVGFGDGRGPAARNRALSRERAEAVLEAVRARVVPRRRNGPLLTTRGHGEALPVACDDTVLGRRLNRRVELWMR